MGYVDYFLIVWDFIKYAKDHGIMVGPGRGSGAGSIVAYCLNITMLDPLKYQSALRALPEPGAGQSMPDIDIDFCYERRQEVIDYVAAQIRGGPCVRRSSPSAPWRPKACMRDVGRVLGYDLTPRWTGWPR